MEHLGQGGRVDALLAVLLVGYNMKSGDYELNFPWPLVMIQDSADPYIYKRIYFPFYGRYIFRNSEMSFVTPLYFRLTRKTEYMMSDYIVNASSCGISSAITTAGPIRTTAGRGAISSSGRCSSTSVTTVGTCRSRRSRCCRSAIRTDMSFCISRSWTLFEYRRFESGEKRFGMLSAPITRHGARILSIYGSRSFSVFAAPKMN